MFQLQYTTLIIKFSLCAIKDARYSYYVLNCYLFFAEEAKISVLSHVICTCVLEDKKTFTILMLFKLAVSLSKLFLEELSSVWSSL